LARPQTPDQSGQQGRVGASDDLARPQPRRRPYLIQGRMVLQQGDIGGLHQPGEVRRGKGGPQRLQGGQGVEHVPEGAELDQENARIRQIYNPVCMSRLAPLGQETVQLPGPRLLRRIFNNFSIVGNLGCIKTQGQGIQTYQLFINIVNELT
jgi:hypothetical protein